MRRILIYLSSPVHTKWESTCCAWANPRSKVSYLLCMGIFVPACEILMNWWQELPHVGQPQGLRHASSFASTPSQHSLSGWHVLLRLLEKLPPELGRRAPQMIWRTILTEVAWAKKGTHIKCMWHSWMKKEGDTFLRHCWRHSLEACQSWCCKDTRDSGSSWKRVMDCLECCHGIVQDISSSLWIVLTGSLLCTLERGQPNWARLDWWSANRVNKAEV